MLPSPMARDPLGRFDYLTLTEAAKVAGCRRQYIAQLIDADRLPCLNVAGKRFVKEEDAKAIVLRKTPLQNA